MAQYALLMYQPAEGGPGPGTGTEGASDAFERWTTFTQDLKDAGLYVVNKVLQGVDSATTVRVRGDEAQVTDGPFTETKEILAGFFVIEAPDLDTALEWAARVPSAGYGSVEIRPAWG